MAQTKRQNGKVTKATVDKASGTTLRLVTVTYPPDPPGDDVTYLDVDEDLFDLLVAAKTEGCDVDVTADHATSPATNVTIVTSK